MSYGERLREIRKSLNLSQQEFGKKLGIATMIVSRLETNDTVLKAPILSKINDLGVNLIWLLTGEGQAFQSRTVEELTQKHYSVPIVDIHASAGAGSVNNQELIIGTTEIGVEFKAYWGKNTVILKIIGDSMYPTIAKDSWVLVRKIAGLKSEGIFVFLHDNELRCKRIQKTGTGDILLKSDNPLYETEVYPKDSLQLGDLILLGEVVGIMNKI
ncbi:MAG: XRE family transcriptional regulator [Brevinema sp.]